MEFTSPRARRSYDAVLDVIDATVVALDFDGTLSPMVADPGAARLHPEAPDALIAVAGVVRAVAVITGRPAAQAVELGALAELGSRMLERGAELFVFGQYGHERWSASDHEIHSPSPPEGLAGFERELGALLHELDASDAFVEEKGLAVAIHTRRMNDPQGALERLREPLAALAERHELALEPGRHVIEVRSAQVHKGHALRTFVAEQQAAGVVFAGDDLGDIEAFEAVRTLREEGTPGVVVCAASDEQTGLVDLADVVVDGPSGTVELLRSLSTRR